MLRHSNILRVVVGGMGLSIIGLGLLLKTSPITIPIIYTVVLVVAGSTLLIFSNAVRIIINYNSLAKEIVGVNKKVKSIHTIAAVVLLSMVICVVGALLSDLSASDYKKMKVFWVCYFLFGAFSFLGIALRLLEIYEIEKAQIVRDQ